MGGTGGTGGTSGTSGTSSTHDCTWEMRRVRGPIRDEIIPAVDSTLSTLSGSEILEQSVTSVIITLPEGHRLAKALKALNQRFQTGSVRERQGV